MKPLITLLILTVTTLCSYLSGQGQTILSKRTIFFKSGQSKVNNIDAGSVIGLIDSLNTDSGLYILVEGHADNVGRYAINKLLARKRALSVRSGVIRAGIAETHITVRSWGPDKPIADNTTKKGRRQNRRVDITFSRPEGYTPAPTKIQDIAERNKSLETPLQRFCIDRFRDTVIRCRQGTVIYIKANTFIPLSDCGGNCISFNIKEDFLKSDMILDDLSTTSDGKILETQGMIYTEALDCKDNKLQPQQGKALVVLIPTDSINPGASVFEGYRGHDSSINWTLNDTSTLSSFTLPQLDLCSRLMCGIGQNTINCQPCRFFFCRIARIGKAAKGLFSTKQKSENRAFRQCRKDLARPPADNALSRRCRAIGYLFKKYGVTDLESLIKVINQPLLDSLKITDMEKLADTLEKLATRKIELSYLDKTISFEDFKYYVYNAPKLGWSNIDCFSNYAQSEKTTVTVNLKAEKNTTCKLIFSDRRIILPATSQGDSYAFNGVPKDVKATIVAIKYEDGKPFLAMKEIVTNDKSVDIDWKTLTLQELKQQLKKLDQ